ncbi:cytochrome P450 2C18-like, partial [Sagmatias obliquidens]|uniref:cytochrome P450 2C18-like n=1 Tax=Sagmatias obliquidens TaxID=3371155 RepID=UPI000F443209
FITNDSFSSFRRKITSTDCFSDDNLVALVSNLFAAGTETTASTLRWGILLMMRYPKTQSKSSKIQNCFNTRLPPQTVTVLCFIQKRPMMRSPKSWVPRMAHRTQISYEDAVIHEVQRFADILPASLPCATTTNIIFKNYYIPKCSFSFQNTLCHIKMKTTFVDSPTLFQTFHFLNSTGKLIKKEAFMPFSAGKVSYLRKVI